MGMGRGGLGKSNDGIGLWKLSLTRVADIPSSHPAGIALRAFTAALGPGLMGLG